MRKLLSHFTDGLFGYRLRYRRWRRWPLLVVLGLVWLPLALWLTLVIVDAFENRPALSAEALRRDLGQAGAAGQAVVAVVLLVFLPLVAARAFLREKTAGNMMDLVLLPVERRRIVMGRLGKVLLPFVLLIVWSSPAYLAAPVSARRTTWSPWTDKDLPLVRMTVAAPVALAGPIAVHSGLFDGWYREIPTVGAVEWMWPKDVPESVGKAIAQIGTVVPFLTVLSFAVCVAVCGLHFSLTGRSWITAALGTYGLAFAVLGAELIPFLSANGRFEGRDFWSAVFTLALILRVALPLLILRLSIRNFDRYALGER